MPEATLWYENAVIPALLRHARTNYGAAMRRALDDAGYDDIPGNGLYLIGGLALGAGSVPLGKLIRDLRISKQVAGQLVDALVTRGCLQRATSVEDRSDLTITLTKRDAAAAAVQARAREHIDQELLSAAGQADIAAMRRVLGALIELGRSREDGMRA